jgi:hypothetical protein
MSVCARVVALRVLRAVARAFRVVAPRLAVVLRRVAAALRFCVVPAPLLLVLRRDVLREAVLREAGLLDVERLLVVLRLRLVEVFFVSAMSTLS